MALLGVLAVVALPIVTLPAVLAEPAVARTDAYGHYEALRSSGTSAPMEAAGTPWYGVATTRLPGGSAAGVTPVRAG